MSYHIIGKIRYVRGVYGIYSCRCFSLVHKIFKNNTVEFLTSDSSLTDYDIEFYNDSNFISKYNTNLITRSGVNGDGNSSTKISVSVGSSLANNFYYRIMGKSGNYIKTLSHFANEDVPNHSEIEVLESKFNINHKVTGIVTNIFRFNPVGVAETALYSPSAVSSGFSSAFYSTKSKTSFNSNALSD